MNLSIASGANFGTMKAGLFAFFLALSIFPLLAQAPVPGATASVSYISSLGFSYSLPGDWQIVDSPAPPTLSGMKDQARQNSASADEKKGMECVQVAFTGRHGEPASVVIAVQLPFACFGQTATEKDLPGFAQGASAQLKQQFNFTDTAQASYSLGSHSVWTERSRGTPKGHPEAPYTTEIACTVLKSGAVCWMAVTADSAALAAFEQGHVVLEGESPAPLVPPSAFAKKPAIPPTVP
jgi:hypothetical protein